VFGYCNLSRSSDIDKYGTLTTSKRKHMEACKEAGCRHPAYYPELEELADAEDMPELPDDKSD
jgi:hypothetical protein